MSKKKVLLRGVFINRDTNGEGVLKVGTTLIRVSTVMGILYFDDIRLVDRDNKVIYPDDTGRKVASVMEEKVNVNRWNEMYKDIAEKFLDTKIDLLQSRRKRKGR